METENERTRRIREVLSEDPLFALLRNTPEKNTFYSETYLEEINEQELYSTTEVARYFDVPIKQIRYYIKPFETYIFASEENPSSESVIRLTFTAILKLRMILLLKDEYRVKGLSNLLGINEEKDIKPQTFSSQEELLEKVDRLSNIVNEMVGTGLFEIKQVENEGQELTINLEFIQQQVQACLGDSNAQIEEIKALAHYYSKENESLKEQLEEIREQRIKDVAISLRERSLENKIIAHLHAEAVDEFFHQKKFGRLKKMFNSSAIENEKELFIADYIHRYLNERLKLKLETYHELSLIG
ncbi:DNA primase [Sporosarcina sp. FA9]|uniref:DNA primase n=1 Tax=Sporosarcina sp. FA9 TaxID=3413030 RepID=UPI003F65DC31